VWGGVNKSREPFKETAQTKGTDCNWKFVGRKGPTLKGGTQRAPRRVDDKTKLIAWVERVMQGDNNESRKGSFQGGRELSKVY